MTISPDAALQVAKDDLVQVMVVFIDYPGDPLRGVTLSRPITFSGTGDLDLDGFTYESILGVDISPLSESEDGQPTEMEFRLAAIDDEETNGTVRSDLLTILNNELWFKARVVCWVGWWDQQQLIVDPQNQRWSGYLSEMPMTFNENQTIITAIANSTLGLAFRNNGFVLSDELQQKAYPGDTGLSFMTKLAAGELLLDSSSRTNAKSGSANARTIDYPRRRNIFDRR